MRRARIIVSVGIALGVLAIGLVRAAPAAADQTSPAGPTTSVVIFTSPAVGIVPVAPAPGVMLGPPPRGLRFPAPATSGPTAAVTLSVLIVTPTPATGSLVVPVRVATAAGPSFTQLQLIIPGPNPAQNTPVSLSQLLNTVLSSLSGAGKGSPPTTVSVLTVPATP